MRLVLNEKYMHSWLCWDFDDENDVPIGGDSAAEALGRYILINNIIDLYCIPEMTQCMIGGHVLSSISLIQKERKNVD